MLVRTTAKIKIKTSPEIIRTIKVYQKALQFCIDTSWNMRIKNNIKLHPFVYKSIRKKGLQSQLAIACIKQACGIVKKAKFKPIINNFFMEYDFPRSASFKNNILSLAAVKGRVKIPFSVPACYEEYFKSWKVCESILKIDKKGRCFFNFSFSKEVNTEGSSLQARVLGIDLGINNLAVTSDNRFFGKDIKQQRIKRDNLISELQAKGTRACKRKLKSLSGKWKQFMAFSNHNISKRIIEPLRSGDVIIMEDLSNIRKTARYNKWVHKWAFRQMQSFIEYKAVRKGIRVVYINPAYTSKTCNRCHNFDTSRNNGFFKCNICSHSIQSDINGARKIAQLYTSKMCWAKVNKPNVTCVDAEAFSISR